jgi:methylmalonyl-CoA mutase cobalamin-binding domain/chain
LSTVSSPRSMAVRRPRRAIVVLAACRQTSDRLAHALSASLEEIGVETIYLGRERSAGTIAAAAADERADAVELCLARKGGGVLLLRELLRELAEIGRRDVSIVVHRVD